LKIFKTTKIIKNEKGLLVAGPQSSWYQNKLSDASD